MKNSKTAGISLVALVVTIIVLIILTGAVIVTFMDGGIIERANEAVFKNDMRAYQELLVILKAQDQIAISTNQKDYVPQVMVEEPLTGEAIKAVVPEFNVDKYGKVVQVIDGKLVAINEPDPKTLEGKCLIDLGIGVVTLASPEPNWDNSQDYLFKIDANGILTDLNEEYYENVDGDIFLYVDTEKEEQVTKVTIPNKIGNVIVTGLGDNLFRSNQSIKEIVIPSTVRSIGNGTFEMSSCLESITILEGLETIGEYAFSDVYNIDNIILPSTLTKIGAHAFSCCSIKSLTILSEDFTLGEEVFGWDYEMTEIKVVNETVQKKVKDAIKSDETCELNSDIVIIIEE